MFLAERVRRWSWVGVKNVVKLVVPVLAKETKLQHDHEAKESIVLHTSATDIEDKSSLDARPSQKCSRSYFEARYTNDLSKH